MLVPEFAFEVEYPRNWEWSYDTSIKKYIGKKVYVLIRK